MPSHLSYKRYVQPYDEICHGSIKPEANALSGLARWSISHWSGVNGSELLKLCRTGVLTDITTSSLHVCADVQQRTARQEHSSPTEPDG